MCGIFGSEKHSSVRGVLHSMRHRGPDSLHVESMSLFSLGLARLAVFDTMSPAAEQPFRSAKDTLTAFNGEIYNSVDLGDESEVRLIASLIEEGFDLRHYLEGDYAVAHFNPSLSRLTLYRDRFGVCPLYFQLHPWVEVSSEQRRLTNPREVPAHGRVEIDLKHRRVRKANTFLLYGAVSGSVSSKSLSTFLIDAVRSRALHADTGFSLALSGGLDSSLVLLALRAAGLVPNECIVTHFSERSDDLFYARQIAEKCGSSLREVPIPPDFASSPEAMRVVEHLDLPDAVRDLSPLRWQGAVRSWFVAKHSQRRVILCGDGGDELLGGYPCHSSPRLKHEVARTQKRLSTLRSMQHFNLDRTNKMGMAHSCEFRAPLLHSTLSQLLLSLPFAPGKKALRELASYLGGGLVADRQSKYSPDEVIAMPPELSKKGGLPHEPQLSAAQRLRKGCLAPEALPDERSA